LKCLLHKNQSTSFSTSNRHLHLGLLLLLALFGAIPLFVFSSDQQQRVATSFVTRNGQKLLLNGQPFRFIGVNRFNLLTTDTPYHGCEEGWSQQNLDAYFAEMQSLHITALRFWAFQSFTENGTDFSRFDYLVSLAQKYHIFLIPVLENQWPDCTQGDYKYNTWYQSGYLSPYGNYQLSYKDYVSLVITRYKDNPYILMWQLMNEAESKNENNNPDPEALYNFALDMSAYVKSIDANHLVSLGTIGENQPGTDDTNYTNLYSISTIDILEIHDYWQEATPLPSFIVQHIADAATLDKPIFIGEAGIQTGCAQRNCYSLQQRAILFQAKMDAFFGDNGNGYLIWSYRNAYSSSDEVWEFDLQDPLAAIVSKESLSLLHPTITR